MSVLRSRIGVAGSFEPDYSLVGARLQKMHSPYPSIPKGEVRIARVETDCLLCQRDHLIDRPCQPFAPA
jgi:hypothetical protein